MKECKNCGEVKPLEDYHRNKEMRDGRSSYCKPCASARAAQWKKSNTDKSKDSDLQRKYGISLKKYLEMYEDQNGCCAICGVEEANAPRGCLFIDHCHCSGLVRGLLCHHCNTGIGYFKEDTENLEKAQVYLKWLLETMEENDHD